VTCRQCSKPLKQTQGRYCSRACTHLGLTAHRRQRGCARCPKALTRQQIGKGQRYCSRACARVAQIETTPMQDALLAILRGQGDWFLTTSDLAIWAYGHDDHGELDAVRRLLSSLRERGYRFEKRVPAWLACHGTTRAYRLISEPNDAVRRAVA
jgi:hypothetical protein